MTIAQIDGRIMSLRARPQAGCGREELLWTDVLFVTK